MRKKWSALDPADRKCVLANLAAVTALFCLLAGVIIFVHEDAQRRDHEMDEMLRNQQQNSGRAK